jgi:DNA-directed RNA polymerase subunit RPC12/RpoP
MSRSAHAQSTYVLHKFPKCIKCKEELVLVYVQYDKPNGERTKVEEEWECPKCGKFIPRRFLKEPDFEQQDSSLHKWCINEQKRERRNNR